MKKTDRTIFIKVGREDFRVYRRSTLETILLIGLPHA
jgi:hypothetical protein